MDVNHKSLSNDTALQIDELIYGCRVTDKEGNRIDPSRVRMSQDGNTIYYKSDEGNLDPIEATIKFSS